MLNQLTNGNNSLYEISEVNGKNTIQFRPGITQKNLVFSASGNDLVISFNSWTNDSINVRDFFNNLSDPNSYSVRYLQFADGSSLDLSDAKTLKLNYTATDASEYLNGNDLNNAINGMGGNDVISGQGGDDVLIGARGDDTINTGSGSNIIVYNLGDGADKIFNDDANNIDTIAFGEGISASDLIFSNSGQDSVIKFKNSEGSLTISNPPPYNFFKSNGVEGAPIYKEYNLKFADGSVNSLKNLNQTTVFQNGSDNSETIWSSPYKSLISARGGDDVINIAGQQVEVLGGEGNDTFVIYNQAGIVAIYDFAAGDRVNLSDINVTDVSSLISQQNEDAVLDFGDGKIIVFKNTDASTLTNDRFDFKINGDDRANVINGNQSNNYIDGKGGDDVITTANGNDKIFGGDGNDFINAGDAINFIDGGTGSDTIIAGIGNDKALGGDGDDTISLDEGNNVIDGGAGNDVIYAGFGIDDVSGGIGNDKFIIAKPTAGYSAVKIRDLEVNNPNEKIDLSAFTNINSFDDLKIDKANSAIYLNGQVTLNLDVTNLTADNFIFAPKIMNGGNGLDDFYVSNGVNQITNFGYNNYGRHDVIHFQNPQMTPEKMLMSYDGNSTFIKFEGLPNFSLELVKFDFTRLNLDSNSLAFDGAPGSKEYHVFYNHNSGSIEGFVNLQYKNAVTFANESDNLIQGNDSDEVINGMAGNDTIRSGGGDNILRGQEGNDYLEGQGRNDTLIGGDGDDSLIGTTDGNKTLTGGNGNDFLSAGYRDPNLLVPDVEKHPIRSQGFNPANDKILDGGDGNDFLYGGTGADTLTGGAGNDTFAYGDFTYSTDHNMDVITDFVQGEDEILLLGEDFASAKLTFDYGWGNTLISDANSDFAIMVQGNVDVNDVEIQVTY